MHKHENPWYDSALKARKPSYLKERFLQWIYKTEVNSLF